MKTFRSAFLITLMMFALGIAMAVAQSAQKVALQPLNADAISRDAAAPSVEQLVLRTAAAKLAAERRPATSVEVPVTVVTSTLPGGCYQICVGSGINRACTVPRPCTK
ncbi:MAG TPA: hypothetical protein VFN10_11030 [Thermoanaerobaculia bacterium]|nr:hypothetical protein [Thermoanaerobaculia bacterium]